jgi:hypothetical protein
MSSHDDSDPAANEQRRLIQARSNIRFVHTPEELIRSVLYIGFVDGDARIWLASGFLVRIDRPNANDLSLECPTFLVTARHVVTKLRFEKKQVVCAVQSMGAHYLECLLPDEAWRLHDEQDIALIRFDFGWLKKPDVVREWPWGRIVSTISIWQFGCAPYPRRQFEFRDPVHMVGLWRRRRDVVWPPIVRTGFFAAISPDRIQLETGLSYAYMIDGTVTRGMSGGLAFMSAGAGLEENSVLGLIHGYLPLPTDELDVRQASLAPADASWDAATFARYEALQQIHRDIDRMNSQIALVIREVEISNFIDEVLGQPPNTMYLP